MRSSAAAAQTQQRRHPRHTAAAAGAPLAGAQQRGASVPLRGRGGGCAALAAYYCSTYRTRLASAALWLAAPGQAF